MSACEYCWGRRWMFGNDYYKSMEAAEKEKAVCTTDTLEGAKARAGQFWDEEKQMDRRKSESPVAKEAKGDPRG